MTDSSDQYQPTPAITIPPAEEELARKFEAYLNANYPCTCGDAECPGNKYESYDLVEIALEVLDS